MKPALLWSLKYYTVTILTMKLLVYRWTGRTWWRRRIANITGMRLVHPHHTLTSWEVMLGSCVIIAIVRILSHRISVTRPNWSPKTSKLLTEGGNSWKKHERGWKMMIAKMLSKCVDIWMMDDRDETYNTTKVSKYNQKSFF